MSFKNLEIWKLSAELVADIHKMTMSLPKFETYEEGSQIRKSIKNVKACIAEGYGRRKYKADFIKFLIYAQASNEETLDHLNTLKITNSLTDSNIFTALNTKLEVLGKMINAFIAGVEKKDWNTKP